MTREAPDMPTMVRSFVQMVLSFTHFQVSVVRPKKENVGLGFHDGQRLLLNVRARLEFLDDAVLSRHIADHSLLPCPTERREWPRFAVRVVFLLRVFSCLWLQCFQKLQRQFQ